MVLMQFYARKVRKMFASGLIFISGMLVVLLLLVACSNTVTVPHVASNKSATASPSLGLVTPHTLTVGSYTQYPPQEYISTKTHEPAGFDIDLINVIGQSMHLKVDIVQADFQTLVDSLMAKRFDLVISAVSITPELQKKVNFVTYFRGGESLLINKGNPQHVQNLEDLCGLNVAAKTGTFEVSDLQAASDTCKLSGKAGINIINLQKYSDGVQMLLGKQVSATFQDLPVTDFFINQHPTVLDKASMVFGANFEGVAVRKDNTALFARLQQTFDQLKTDGSYHQLIEKWGLIDGDITIPANQKTSFSESIEDESKRSV